MRNVAQVSTIDLKGSRSSLLPYFDDSIGEKARDNRLYATKRSFRWFMYLYFDHIMTLAPASFHEEGYDHAMEPRLLVVWFRGSGKSETWSVGYPLWVGLNNPYGLNMEREIEHLCLISRAGDLPEQWISRHKEELVGNARIKADYRVEEGDTWRNDQITFSGVNGRAKITSKGSGAQIRGLHPTEVVVDDLEDRREGESATLRSQTKRYFYRDLYGTLRRETKDKARLKIIGTPVNEEALLPELKEKPWLKCLWHGARDEQGKPSWPEYLDDQGLDAMQSEMEDDPGSFATEILCRPTTREHQIYSEEWLRWYSESDPEWLKIRQQGFYTVISVDPATKRKDRTDYTAIMVISAADSFELTRYYIRAGGIVRCRDDHTTIIQKIAGLYETFAAAAVIFETIGFQEIFADEWMKHCKAHHWHPKIICVEPIRDKETRARANLGLHSRGQVYLAAGDPLVKKLRDEMMVFPTGEHDDLVDAKNQGLDHMKIWDKKKRRPKKRSRLVGREPDPVYRLRTSGR